MQKVWEDLRSGLKSIIVCEVKGEGCGFSLPFLLKIHKSNVEKLRKISGRGNFGCCKQVKVWYNKIWFIVYCDMIKRKK